MKTLDLAALEAHVPERFWQRAAEVRELATDGTFPGTRLAALLRAVVEQEPAGSVGGMRQGLRVLAALDRQPDSQPVQLEDADAEHLRGVIEKVAARAPQAYAPVLIAVLDALDSKADA